MKKALALGIVVVIVLAAGYAFFSPPSEPVATTGGPTNENPSQTANVSQTTSGTQNSVSTPAPSKETQTTIVTYSDAGFSPHEIHITAGAVVAFKNESSHPMWVASNPHPSHTIYPEFDARRGYAPGESYSFTFTRVGSWGYHDHLHSRNGGKVIVE